MIVIHLSDKDQLEYLDDLISKDCAGKAGAKLFAPQRLCLDRDRGVLFVASGCGKLDTLAAGLADSSNNTNSIGSLTVWKIL